MSDATLHTRSIEAVSAITKWAAIAKEAFAGSVVNFVIHTDVVAVRLAIRGVPSSSIMAHEEVKVMVELLSRKSYCLTCVYVEVTDISGPAIQNNVRASMVFSIVDGVGSQVVLKSFGDDPRRPLIAINALSNHLEIIPKSSLGLEAMPRAERQAIKYKEEVTSELHAQVEKIAAASLAQQSKQDEFFLKIAADHDERRKRMEDEFAEREREVRESFKQKEDALERSLLDKREALEVEREDVRKLREDLDTRNNTLVRRDLLQKLTKMVDGQKAVMITTSTSSKRLPIHIICFGALASSALLVFAFVRTVIADDRLHLHHTIPLSAGIAVFASTLVYYLRWNDQWFREHSTAEFRTRKLSSDVIRAGWLAELVFEVKEKEKQLPDVLLNRFSEGLFVDASNSPTEHPADQMVALLGKVTSLKAGKDGGEVTMAPSKEK